MWQTLAQHIFQICASSQCPAMDVSLQTKSYKFSSCNMISHFSKQSSLHSIRYIRINFREEVTRTPLMHLQHSFSLGWLNITLETYSHSFCTHQINDYMWHSIAICDCNWWKVWIMKNYASTGLCQGVLCFNHHYLNFAVVCMWFVKSSIVWWISSKHDQVSRQSWPHLRNFSHSNG